MKDTQFSVLGPLMGGFGSQAFLGCLHADAGDIKPAVFVFLPEEIVADIDLFRRVWQETQAGMQIDHVNVIGVMGLARLDEGYARVVEYADAESLRSVMRRATTMKKPIPQNIAAALVADACMGVHYAHELGLSERGEPMIHGGLRPETLQVSFQGMAKVTGYGATTIAEIARKQRKEEGRDPYTSPEQAYGGRAAVSAKSDVYALGCILYEAMTGKAPYSAENELAQAMMKDEFSPPTMSGAAESLAQIVLRATRRLADERYATALDMRMAILENGGPASAADVVAYLDDLFPAGTVPRATRRQLLKSATSKPPAPTGKLLREFPVELRQATRTRASVPTDAEIEASVGRSVVQEPSGAQFALPTTTPNFDRAAFDDPTSPVHARPITGESAVERVVQRALDRRTLPPSTALPPTIPPHTSPPQPLPPQHGMYAPSANFPQQAPYAAPPAVAYRTPPAMIAGFSVAITALLFLGFYLWQSQKAPPPPVVIAAPPPPPPPEPPPQTPAPPTTPPATTPPTEAPKEATKEPPAKETPRPAPTGPGTIRVTADPATLVISVDGKVVGTGTGSAEAKPGSHKVIGKDPSTGAIVSKTVSVRPGQTVEVELEAKQGGLAFDQLPPGVQVIVDGKLIGTTPMPAIQLWEGPHKAVVKKGGVEIPYKLQILGGREMFITATFDSP